MENPESLLEIGTSDSELSNLERLGVFFRSQIHDLNNQMAVLTNAELLWEISSLETPPEMKSFLAGIFTSIHRLSAMCEQFNVALKTYPLEVDQISVEEAVTTIFGIIGDIKGWSASCQEAGSGAVHLNISWISTVVPQLIRQLGSEDGIVSITIGTLPLRHYQLGLRNPSGVGEKRVLQVQFMGSGPDQAKTVSDEMQSAELQITMELIRVMGAALSMGRSDNHRDYLLAFPMP